MNNNISKTIIRIIQDHCLNNSAPLFINEFAISITPQITRHIQKSKLDLMTLKNIAQKRKDFIIANNLDVTLFCKGLFKKLNYELSFYDEISFYESMLIFKRKMENGNFRGFKKGKINEDTLRSTLAIYIQQETFCEPRAGAGNSDITVPLEKIIIETKLWDGIEYYNSGFPELNDYLEKNGYKEGYYVVFDYNQTPNQVIIENGETFDFIYSEKLIHIIFVKMNATPPSRIYREHKKSK